MILCDYLEERQGITTVAGHEDAVFLSMQNRRITVRAVENLVKKYSKLVTNIKNITPHKLRSTYGTSLYKATGDIYLVADVLGHKDVNTTKKHYAALEDDRRRKAAKYVHLREDCRYFCNLFFYPAFYQSRNLLRFHIFIFRISYRFKIICISRNRSYVKTVENFIGIDQSNWNNWGFGFERNLKTSCFKITDLVFIVKLITALRKKNIFLSFANFFGNLINNGDSLPRIVLF